MTSLSALDAQLRQIAATYSGNVTYALTDLAGGAGVMASRLRRC